METTQSTESLSISGCSVSKLLLQMSSGKPCGRTVDWILVQAIVQQFEVQLQVLNHAVSEVDVGVADVASHFLSVLSSQSQHFCVAVDSNHSTFRTNNLSHDVTQLAGAGSKIEHGIALVDIDAGIAATVVFIDHLLRNGLQILANILNRATQRWLHLLRGSRIAFVNRCLR